MFRQACWKLWIATEYLKDLIHEMDGLHADN